MRRTPVVALTILVTLAAVSLASAQSGEWDLTWFTIDGGGATSSAGEGFALIDAVAEVGRPVLVLSGGEPLMREDIFSLAAHARKKNLPVALASNGTLITDKIAEKIRDAGIRRVSVSLDGADAATHDGFRKLSGSFDLALAGLQRVRSAGVSCQINSPSSYHDRFFRLDSNIQDPESP